MEIVRKINGYKGKYTNKKQEVSKREFTVKLVTSPKLMFAIEDPKSKTIEIMPFEDIMGLIDDINKRIEEKENAERNMEGSASEGKEDS